MSKSGVKERRARPPSRPGWKGRAPLPWDQILAHMVLMIGVIVMMGPLVVVFLSSTHEAPTLHREGLQIDWGGHFSATYGSVLVEGTGFGQEVNGLRMLGNSMILGLGFAIGKIVISLLAAYAIVYFRFPLGTVLFWVIFSALLLPLEVRILPSYEVVQSLGLLNTYTGLILPLIASAIGTFFFRQFFRSVPSDLLDDARVDGAGWWRFLIDILIPLSRTMIAALFIIMFVVGWNQYLWPALMTTEESLFTIVRGIKQYLQVIIGTNYPEYNKALALAVLALLPPALVVIVFQRWFIRGLLDSER